MNAQTHEYLKQALVSSAMEGLPFLESEVEIAKKILGGEMTQEEYFNMVKSRKV